MTQTSGQPSLALPCAAAAVQAFAFMNHAPLMSTLIADLHITPTQAGLLSTAMVLSAGIVCIPLGGLTDRFGPKRVVGIGIALVAVSAFAAGLAPSYAVLLLTRLIAGVSFAIVFVAGGRYINAFWQGDRQYLAQGLHGGVMQLGIGGAIFLLPLVATRFGWRGAFMVSSIPPFVVWLLWEWKARAGAAAASRATISSVLSNGTIWRLGVAHSATFGIALVLGTWIAVYLTREFGLPLAAAGALGSVVPLVGVAGRPLGGALVARGLVNPRRMVQVPLAALLIALVMMAWPGRPLGVALFGMAVAGTATTLGFASIVALTARAAPGAPGAALGLLALVLDAFVIVGAPLVGALLTRSGSFTMPFGALALLPVVALVLLRKLPVAA